MLGYHLSLSNPIVYEYTGKFQAPSVDWEHEKMPLMNYELIVMTEGRLYLSYAEKNYVVKEGEYLLLSPTSPISYRKGFKTAYCSFYWLHFTIDNDVTNVDLSDPDLELMKNENTVLLPAKARLAYPDKVIVLMKQLQDSIRSGCSSLTKNYMSTTVLCELYDQTFKEKIENIRGDYSKKQVYYDIVDYISENIYQELKVTDIAEKFGYNAKYLSHVFNCITGTSLKQFVLQKKVAEANFMLMDTNKTVREISVCLGFSDYHNFMKTYKKLTGLTPTGYRNAYAKRMLFHV